MRPISICMPYWNRRAELMRSLEAYERLYPDLDIEYSICDDGSPEQLRDVWPWFRSSVQVTSLPRKTNALNPCVPINVAVRQASRDVIVLTNPEIEHRDRVLDKMLDALTGPNDYVMTGCRDTSGAWYAGPMSPRAPIGGRAPIPRGTELHFCVMMHRALFERAGGFDEEYRDGHAYDDNDWLFRLWALGDVNFKYVDGIVWHHKGASRSLWKAAPLERNKAIFERKWKEKFSCAL